MDGIFELEDALTENDCDRIIENYNENIEHAQPGEITATNTNIVNKIIKNTMDLYLPIENDISTFSSMRIIHNACKKVIEKYIEHFQELGFDRGDHATHSLFETIMNRDILTYPQIQKVKPGGRFNWHSDYSPKNLIQFIFYLNDDYDGGRTEFSNGRIIEPKKGKVVIIPCTPQAIHRGNVVKSGTKYICAVYLESCNQ